MAWRDANVLFASSHNVFSILLKLSQPFTETFYLPFQNHYMKLTLKMTDDLPWSLNWVSPGAGLWLPVCSCVLDLNYIAIFASSRLVLLFSCTKYVWVGKAVWSSEKNQEQACSVFWVPLCHHWPWASVFSSIKWNNNNVQLAFIGCLEPTVLSTLCSYTHLIIKSNNNPVR